jgi:hypothetical protein
MVIESTTLVGAAAAASAVTAAILVLAESSMLPPPVIITPEVVEIIAHKTLRLYCLLGALGGGVLAVMLTATAPPREMAAKWTVGVVSALLFTPWLVRLANVTPSPDYIMAAAGGVALLSWGCLHKLIPVLERVVLGRARGILGDKSDPSAR